MNRARQWCDGVRTDPDLAELHGGTQVAYPSVRGRGIVHMPSRNLFGRLGQMITKFALGFVVALSAVVVPSAAFAEGAVKVECWGRCDLVNLGQICDSYSSGSVPVAVSCDDTGVGNGTSTACGVG